METPEQTLVRDLMHWSAGDPLDSLIERAVEIAGPPVAVDLALDPARAREQLLDRLSDWMG